MSANQAMYAIAAMCRVLEVSTSGYYAWPKRPRSARARADAQLTVRIPAIHEGSRATCGAPRIHAELAAQGITAVPDPRFETVEFYKVSQVESRAA